MQLVFPVDKQGNALRLGLFLRRQGISASLLKSVKYTPGGLRVNGMPARTNAILQTGDRVQFTLPKPGPLAVEPEEIPFAIWYESPHAMVIEKPAGLVMHPTLSHHSGTLANGFAWLMAQRGESHPLRPLGRLDADTSGLVLCAMNGYAAPSMAQTSKKAYLALVHGQVLPETGCIDQPIAARQDSAILQQISPIGRPSLTNYQVLASNSKASLVLVQPKTGRTHQIRVHFSWFGHPLLGDGLYGGKQDWIKRHALHCAKVWFREPGAQETSVFSALPQDMLNAMEKSGLKAETEEINALLKLLK